MNDILERLRESVHWIVSYTSNVPTKYIHVMDDAYNEIQHLRHIEEAARYYMEKSEHYIECSFPGLTPRSTIREQEESRDALAAALKKE